MSGSRFTFLRQGTLMIAATALSGLLMMASSIVAQRMEPAEFAVFRVLLVAYFLMGFPTIGLQLVFTQETATAGTHEDRARLAGTARAVLLGTFFLWMITAGGAWLGQDFLLTWLKISDPAALWLTVGLGLSSLWLPVLRGLLQGTQNFAGYGGVLVIDGLLRFVAVLFLVSRGGQSAAGLSGALAGQIAALGLGFWLTRNLWRTGGRREAWKPWFARVTPLTVGFASVLLMTSADALYAQAVFPAGSSQFYLAPQLVGVALFTATMPLALVIFPKIVASARQAQRSDALRLALGSTGVILGAAALLLTFFPRLPMRIIFYSRPEWWHCAVLVPWFAWALVPLILANVLVNDLMARERFGIAPWLAVIAGCYGAALYGLRGNVAGMETFAAAKLVLGTLGFFSALMLTAAIVFQRKQATGNPSPS